MAAEAPSVFIYQLRVWLREISPVIWRRLLVRSDSNIADLHYTLQIAMGWTDTHLHQFLIRGKSYGIAQMGGIGFTDDPRQVRLGSFRFRDNERFLYEYDFGDFWAHEIRIEKRLPFDQNKTYPVCIGGGRLAPPEDCGGPWAFMELEQHYSPWYIAERFGEVWEQLERGAVEALRDESFQEELRTIQYWLQVNRFSRRIVNRRLKQYALGNEEWQWTLGDLPYENNRSSAH
jgi:hypothetical protein